MAESVNSLVPTLLTSKAKGQAPAGTRAWNWRATLSNPCTNLLALRPEDFRLRDHITLYGSAKRVAGVTSPLPI